MVPKEKEDEINSELIRCDLRIQELALVLAIFNISDGYTLHVKRTQDFNVDRSAAKKFCVPEPPGGDGEGEGASGQRELNSVDGYASQIWSPRVDFPILSHLARTSSPNQHPP